MQWTFPCGCELRQFRAQRFFQWQAVGDAGQRRQVQIGRPSSSVRAGAISTLDASTRELLCRPLQAVLGCKRQRLRAASSKPSARCLCAKPPCELLQSERGQVRSLASQQALPQPESTVALLTCPWLDVQPGAHGAAPLAQVNTHEAGSCSWDAVYLWEVGKHCAPASSATDHCGGSAVACRKRACTSKLASPSRPAVWHRGESHGAGPHCAKPDSTWRQSQSWQVPAAHRSSARCRRG
jgi:hypothetical protein